jgi:small redox-active disulfide protein 2
MKTIQILGTGCPKCTKLAENAEAAAEALGIEYELVKISDLNEMARMGVMVTPGLAIDGQLKSSGRLLSIEEIRNLL